MRRRWMFVILLVVIAVLVGGGYAGQRVVRDHRLARQRADYAAGLDAAHRADCPRALRLLSAARSGGSRAATAAAEQGRRGCDYLESVEAQSARQSRTVAVTSWMDYLSVTRAAPYQAIGRKSARTVLTSQPLNKILTESLCWQQKELTTLGVLSSKGSDPLTSDFMIQCIALQIGNDPKGAVQTYFALRKRFPELADTKANLALLGRAVKSQLTPAGIADGKSMVPDGGRFSFGGNVQLILTGTQKAPLQIVLAGRISTLIVTVPGCASCSNASNDKDGLRQCNQRRAMRVVYTIPADRYVMGQVDVNDPDDLLVELWGFKPNKRYESCWWTYR